jgi:hypothetical protein
MLTDVETTYIDDPHPLRRLMSQSQAYEIEAMVPTAGKSFTICKIG